MVRVVAGSLRGRRLQAPAGEATRPTSDRVREAIFNALASLDAMRGGRARPLRRLGRARHRSALTRASRCTSWNRLAGAGRAPANLDALGLAERATVAPMDVPRFLATAPSADLVLADPPYAFDGWAVSWAVSTPTCWSRSTGRSPRPGWDVVRPALRHHPRVRSSARGASPRR